MKALRLLVCVLALSFLATSCGDDGGGDGVACVPCDATARPDGIGSLNIGQGDDSVARKMLDNCGYHVHLEHNGGQGDTLQIGKCAAPNGQFGIVLVWASNRFEGWRVCVPAFEGEIVGSYDQVENCYFNTNLIRGPKS